MSEETKKKVGNIIKQARKEKGLTQKELAERLGVTKTIVTNYEAGKQNLTLDTLDNIANALGVSLLIGLK